ncbi:hypothetical protein DI487_00910 [Flavobacterium sediminis]|uniref:Guanylate cyclase domain-containing protein n=1 Tax=Flavobacterium sediminis TaxID=2201181 RepID=A0A2U8QR67_9FLAO|nr:hypothetical protein [Flavobacterium sediminis]AWM12571.1 hypothetical protein DI487_00910 [Flavobacterium sediminis]
MLDYHFVAFLDILGYSNMVKSDLEGPSGEEKYFQKLLDLHKETNSLKYEKLEFTLIQFSDSIIISAPFDHSSFHSFSKLIAEYQLKLLLRGILIRGGVTYGKHYYKDDFLFSSGLIDAYGIESKLARYPRIIISNDLFELMVSHKVNLEYTLNDNNYKIIDFIKTSSIEQVQISIINDIIEKLERNKNETISEKGLWLKEYINFKIPSTPFQYIRFRK